MNRFKNLLHRARAGFLVWYGERSMRRVFLYAMLAALLCLILAQFYIPYMGYAAMACAALGLFASTADTVQSSREFKAYIEEIKRQHFIRMAEMYEPEAAQSQQCFSPEDMLAIKRKKGSFRGAIAAKIFFIIILIALLFIDLL